jgi:hypothetical protein
MEEHDRVIARMVDKFNRRIVDYGDCQSALEEVWEEAFPGESLPIATP